MKAIGWFVAVSVLLGALWFAVDPAGRETVLRTEAFLLGAALAATLAVVGHRRFADPDPGPFEPPPQPPNAPRPPLELERLRTDFTGLLTAEARVGVLLRQRVGEVAASRLRTNHRMSLGDPGADTVLGPVLAAALRPGARLPTAAETAPSVLLDALERL